MAIVSLGSISGAHINPAVTIALWSVGRHDRRFLTSYVGAQCAGAMLAGLAIRVVVGDAAAAAATTPAIPVAAAFRVELVFSAILMWVIMRVTVASGVWSVHWLYWIAPIVGMVGSAHVHELLMSRDGRRLASAAPNPAIGN